jgi:RimJ/RimL family protein N-acetyltransferase
MLIRRAEPDDWHSLREVRLAALQESPGAFGSTLERERDADEEHWRGWASGEGWGGDVATFVADDEGGFVGMATGFDPEDEPGVVHLFGMWVRPERRREGIARELVERVVAWAGERSGVEHLVLRVTISNDAAVSLYASCGFVRTADPPEPLREGSTVSTATMRRGASRTPISSR